MGLIPLASLGERLAPGKVPRKVTTAQTNPPQYKPYTKKHYNMNYDSEWNNSDDGMKCLVSCLESESDLGNAWMLVNMVANHYSVYTQYYDQSIQLGANSPYFKINWIYDGTEH